MSQSKQKAVHDRKEVIQELSCDKVFVYMPVTKTGPAYKLARPYKGSYLIIKNYDNGVELHLVEHPEPKVSKLP